MLRLSLSDDSYASQAVLYALVALSAVHRYGGTAQVAQFKCFALNALWKASNGNINDPAQAQQHVAANLMLCRVEVSYPTTAFRVHDRCKHAATLTNS